MRPYIGYRIAHHEGIFGIGLATGGLSNLPYFVHSDRYKMNFEVLKESRGFMKVLQFFFAILAFATTSGFSTHFSFHAKSTICNRSTVVNHTIGYPFSLDHESDSVNLCPSPPNNASHVVKFMYSGNVVSNAKFYVALGVICMLLSAGLLLFYAYKEEYTMSRAATIELGVNAVLTILLFAGSCAWADGVRVLKQGADPSVWVNQLCADIKPAGSVLCHFDSFTDFNGDFGKVNASLIFGFLNVFLWVANLWFIYKETASYVRSRQMSTPYNGETTGNI